MFNHAEDGQTKAMHRHSHLSQLLSLGLLLGIILGPIAQGESFQAQKQSGYYQQQAKEPMEPPASYGYHQRYQQQQPSPGFNLEEPPLLGQQVPYILGPAVDLVALNRRRFELEHQHSTGSSEPDLRRTELIESKLSSLPELMMANLPDRMNKQILETVAQDASLNLKEASESIAALVSEDPDNASIERLTKSCLTVHASSNRPEELNVTFLLYTKNNPQVPYVMGPQVSRLELIKSSPFDPRRPLKWITHGFHTNVDKSEWMVETKDKVLAYEDSNVILTDWRRGASPALAFYPKAAANAHVVAKMIVKILRRLRQDLDFSRIHLIGHSLGAHIMGFVGSAFTEEYLHQQQQMLQLRPLSNLKPPQQHQLIGRITACDPALPCFGPTSSAPSSHQPQQLVPVSGSSEPTAQVIPNKIGAVEYQLSEESTISNTYAASSPHVDSDWTPTMWTHLRPDSAVVVEVMHSNPGVMGYAEPLGDYDFYPNGFERQPGCGVSNPMQPSGGESSPELGPTRHFLSTVRQRRQLLASQSLRSSSRAAQAPSSLGGTFVDRLIKPIRDFFHGYTCSHHRSVEYMVESMYYERVAQDRKLDRDHVCQMVGYRCSDYLAFKRGFCFRCPTNLDCRTFTMSTADVPSMTAPASIVIQQQQHFSGARRAMGLAKRWLKPTEKQHSSPNSTTNINKRILPTFNPQQQNYLPQIRSKYYFDTKNLKDYCAHHYHLLIKYRWFRVRTDVAADGFRLMGTLHNISQMGEATFNRFNYQSYTLLLTDAPHFLGQIEALMLYGDRIRGFLIEYIEVTYMSNLDARIRALGSAKLCRHTVANSQELSSGELAIQPPLKPPSPHLFVRCSGATMV